MPNDETASPDKFPLTREEIRQMGLAKPGGPDPFITAMQQRIKAGLPLPAKFEAWLNKDS